VRLSTSAKRLETIYLAAVLRYTRIGVYHATTELRAAGYFQQSA
jgi:hypothetical protein